MFYLACLILPLSLARAQDPVPATPPTAPATSAPDAATPPSQPPVEENRFAALPEAPANDATIETPLNAGGSNTPARSDNQPEQDSVARTATERPKPLVGEKACQLIMVGGGTYFYGPSGIREIEFERADSEDLRPILAKKKARKKLSRSELKLFAKCDLQGALTLQIRSAGQNPVEYNIPAVAQLLDDKITLRLSIPEGLPRLGPTWEVLNDSKKVVAHAALELVNLAAGAEQVKVRIDVEYAEFPDLNAGIAKDTIIAAPQDERVWNAVALTFPSDFPSGNWSISPSTGMELWCVTTQAWTTACESSSLGEIIVRATRATEQPRYIKIESEARVFEIKIAERAAHRSIPLPMARATSLYCPKKRPGSKAQMPVRNGQTTSASDSALRGNACNLRISKDELRLAVSEMYPEVAALQKELARPKRKNPKCNSSDGYVEHEYIVCPADDDKEQMKKIDRLIGLHGRQSLTILVARGDGTPVERQIAYDFRRAPRLLEIPVTYPEGEHDPNAAYQVYVVNRTQDGPYAVPTTAPDTSSSPKPGPDDLVGRVRPRGQFGWATNKRGNSVRVYLTIPVNATTLQVPSSGMDLSSTTDSRWLQQTTFDFGLLLAVEPWNYNEGEHAWGAVPIIFTTGILNRGIGTTSGTQKQAFQRPFWVLGPEFTFPIWKGRKNLDTAVAVGVLYGMDLRQQQPGKTGSHLLVTLGFNFFSLLGAPSKDSKD